MWYKKLAIILTIIGGLNWGLVGALNFNLVTFIFGDMSILTQIIYIAVGLASIATIFFVCQCCGMKKDK